MRMLLRRRVWAVLSLGVGALLLLRFVASPASPSPKGRSASSHGFRLPSFRLSLQGSRFDGPSGPDCAFSSRSASVDWQTSDIWRNLSTEKSQIMMNDNYWAELRSPRRPPKETLRVFLMPHSHADPGWLRTYVEYSEETNAALDYMLGFLPTHRNMTFTWTEVSFFKLWWERLGEAERAGVKDLIRRGQLELTSGSWTMTDEANPYFWASVDNIVEGHQFLHREVGVVPKVEWSNDPFGYGPSVPLLFARSGIRHLAINRVHRSVKMFLQRAGASVFRWRQFWDGAGSEDVTTQLLPFLHYDVPNSCGPDPAVCCQFDFKRLTHFTCPGPMPVPITRENVVERAAALYDQYRKTAQLFPKAPVLLLLLGDDFRFKDKAEWSQQHDNYQRLFKYMNSHPTWNIKASFGTFSDYFAELERQVGKGAESKLPSLSGDFFPYHDIADHYWTGYFTSRPHYKRMDRQLQAKIRSADLLSAFAQARTSAQKGLRKLWAELHLRLESARRALALFQHHDAITGTSKWHVVEDYGRRLYKGLFDAALVGALSAQLLLQPEAKAKATNPGLDDLHLPRGYNVSEISKPIELREGETVKLSVFNSLGWPVTEAIKVHVEGQPFLSVRAEDGGVIQAQVNPVLSYPSGILPGVYEFVFLYKLRPLSLSTFSVRAERSLPSFTSLARVHMGSLMKDAVPAVFKAKPLPKRPEVFLKTARLRTRHSGATGLMVESSDRSMGGARELQMEFLHYRNTRSGAYLFLPSEAAQPWPTDNPTVVLVRGPLVQSSHTFLQRIHSVTTIYNSSDAIGAEISIENTVDLRDMSTSELVLRIHSPEVESADTFYTDSVGLQLLRREYFPESRVETNYYPMPSALVLQDTTARLSVLSGQPHGATSPEEGVAEIMLDRIAYQDDFKGLGSDSLLRDNVPASSHFRLLLEKRVKGASNETLPNLAHSALAQQSLQRLLYPATVLRHRRELGEAEAPLAGLSEPLACDASLMTARPLPASADRLLLLHRPMLDCSVEAQPSLTPCTVAQGRGWAALLKALGSPTVRETNLAGLKPQESTSNINLDTMDIKAYRLSMPSPA